MSEGTTTPSIPIFIHGEGAEGKTLCGIDSSALRAGLVVGTALHGDVTCPGCVAYIRQVHEDANTEAAPAAESTGLTLDTYEPSTAVTMAIEAAVSQGADAGLAVMARLLTIASAAALGDLIEKGVAPYAESPGVLGEVNHEASRALTDWVYARAREVALRTLLDLASVTVLDLRGLFG